MDEIVSDFDEDHVSTEFRENLPSVDAQEGSSNLSSSKVSC